MARSSPDPRDVDVGARVRIFRLKSGLSQEKVAAVLGVTFQQVQKYEKGTNRTAPSRLLVLAKLFKVPVAAFFGEDGNGKSNGVDLRVTTRQRLRILELLEKINSVKVEQHVVDLLETISSR
jgi:transcriptional regulator with XRE-family HTH domain